MDSGGESCDSLARSRLTSPSSSSSLGYSHLQVEAPSSLLEVLQPNRCHNQESSHDKYELPEKNPLNNITEEFSSICSYGEQGGVSHNLNDSSASVELKDVWKCGYLRMLKPCKKRFFVLKGPSNTGPSRLEYYDNEKTFKYGMKSFYTPSRVRGSPKNIIYLHQCFNVSKRADSKHRYLIALYTKDEYFAMEAESEEEQEDWCQALNELMTKEKKDHRDTDELDDGFSRKYGTIFKEVWQVIVKPKGLGQTKNLTGLWRLCLSTQTICLVKMSSDIPSVNLPLWNVRGCGHSESFFFLDLGHLSSTGPGEIWMQVDSGDPLVAKNMHRTILEAMKALRTIPDFRPRSVSQSCQSNPCSVIYTRRHHRGILPPSQTGLQYSSRSRTCGGQLSPKRSKGNEGGTASQFPGKFDGAVNQRNRFGISSVALCDTPVNTGLEESLRDCACTSTTSPGMVPCTSTTSPGTVPCTSTTSLGMVPCTSTTSPGMVPCTSTTRSGMVPCTSTTSPGMVPCTSTTSPGMVPCTFTTSHGLLPCTSTTSPGMVPCTSTTSPGIVPCTSTTSPVMLPCTSTTSPGIVPCTSTTSPGMVPCTSTTSPGMVPCTSTTSPGMLPCTSTTSPSMLPYTSTTSPGMVPYTSTTSPGMVPYTSTTSPNSGSLCSDKHPCHLGTSDSACSCDRDSAISNLGSEVCTFQQSSNITPDTLWNYTHLEGNSMADYVVMDSSVTAVARTNEEQSYNMKISTSEYENTLSSNTRFLNLYDQSKVAFKDGYMSMTPGLVPDGDDIASEFSVPPTYPGTSVAAALPPNQACSQDYMFMRSASHSHVNDSRHDVVCSQSDEYVDMSLKSYSSSCPPLSFNRTCFLTNRDNDDYVPMCYPVDHPCSDVVWNSKQPLCSSPCRTSHSNSNVGLNGSNVSALGMTGVSFERQGLWDERDSPTQTECTGIPAGHLSNTSLDIRRGQCATTVNTDNTSSSLPVHISLGCPGFYTGTELSEPAGQNTTTRHWLYLCLPCCTSTDGSEEQKCQ